MEEVQKHAAAQKEFNRRLLVAVEDVAGDVTRLKKEIEDIQNSPGRLSPEDQTSLDEAQSDTKSLTEKLEALAALVENPPVVPVPEPGPAPEPGPEPS